MPAVAEPCHAWPSLRSGKRMVPMADKMNVETEIRRVIARAWSDSAFKPQLLTDANAALESMGYEIPDGLTIRVVEDTPGVRHYVLPQPQSSELSDDHLEAVAGGIIIVGGVNRLSAHAKK